MITGEEAMLLPLILYRDLHNKNKKELFYRKGDQKSDEVYRRILGKK